MDNSENTYSLIDNPWTIYIIGILLFIILFFIQKYIHLVDRKLSSKINSQWEGTPWPLISSLGLGFLLFVFGVFLPDELSFNPSNWSWPEIIILIGVVSIISGLIIESINKLGQKLGVIRFVIYFLLSIIYFYTGLLAGLYFAVLLSLTILVYFIFFWKKRLKIN